MNIVFFVHPDFFDSQSMPRFASMLHQGMLKRGHAVQVWKPTPRLYKWSNNKVLRKWLGYVDQFVWFPVEVREKIKFCPADTLYVFLDNALGPWVPLVADRSHVIHCHDFLAQNSALGNIPECQTSWSGKKYQQFIRNGFTKGKNFISVSNKTREDLHVFISPNRVSSQVVYNGIRPRMMDMNINHLREDLTSHFNLDLSKGYILHVGGNQWYKNRIGVLEIYHAWRTISAFRIPLIFIGEAPSAVLFQQWKASSYALDIHFFSHVDDTFVHKAYCGASLFLFPSIAEGFGWPIAEAMAAGTPVITTNEAPMTEVSGDAAFLIPKRPHNPLQQVVWAIEAGKTLEKILCLPECDRKKVIDRGVANAKRFDVETAIDHIEQIYGNILKAVS